MRDSNRGMCSDRVAVVTGAGQGIGRSIALTLAREGASVVINYLRNQEQAADVVACIDTLGGNALAVQANIFVAEECSTLLQTARAHFGHVDICVISPGSGWHPDPPDTLNSQAALEDVEQEVAPCLHLLPLILPEMYQQKWGRVIALTTNAHVPSPAFAYNAAKAARAQILAIVQDAAWQHGVTVNAIAPAPVKSISTLEEAVEQCHHGAAWQNRSTTSPQDIAEIIAYLCSDAGRYITGCMLPFQFCP